MPDRRRGRTPRGAGAARARAATPTLLAVKIGNSDTVIGVFRGARLAGSWRFASARVTAAAAGLRLDRLARRVAVRRPAAAVLCSVVPALTRSWAGALTRWCGRAPLVVGPDAAAMIRIHYRDPRALGADRIANAIAARELYGAPAIVVDLGTATTFDCVSAGGEYLGGAIAPGVGSSAAALFRHAARVPRVALRRPRRAIGRTTAQSVRSGVLWGAAGQVDALVRRLAREMKGTPQVVATGGWAELVAPECATVGTLDPALTLKGMRLIWEAGA